MKKEELNELLQRLKTMNAPLECYPVGAYFETSDDDFDPNNAWGGVWVISNGKWHRIG